MLQELRFECCYLPRELRFKVGNPAPLIPEAEQRGNDHLVEESISDEEGNGFGKVADREPNRCFDTLVDSSYMTFANCANLVDAVTPR